MSILKKSHYYKQQSNGVHIVTDIIDKYSYSFYTIFKPVTWGMSVFKSRKQARKIIKERQKNKF